jgi:hypothetical protein
MMFDNTINAAGLKSNCTSILERREGSNGDRYRVLAGCNYLAPGTLARGVLTPESGPSVYTPWLYEANSTVASVWVAVPTGAHPTTRIEYVGS